MRFSLQNKRHFWIVIGAANALTLALLLFVVIHLRPQASAARDRFEHEAMELKRLQAAPREDIPSQESITGQKNYREWLNQQAALVHAFLMERTALLEAPITGQGETTPAQFEDSYMRSIKTQKQWLEREQSRGRMVVQNLNDAYANYPWMTGPTQPVPEEYTNILRDYWGRTLLYQALLDTNAQSLRSLKLGRAVKLSPEFQGLPLSIDVVVPPDKAPMLVDRLLAVSPSLAGRPIIQLKRLTLSPELLNSRPMAGLQLECYILLYKP